jgi:endonuclease VIII
MPEGPSIIILKELILPFRGKKILDATGNASIDMNLLKNQKISDIRSWGKQLFFVLGKINIRIHLLLFGSYSLDEQTKPDRSVRLCLRFKKGSIYFYTCSVRILQEQLDTLYDWSADVMSDEWDPLKARKKLKVLPQLMACDALLDQQIFSGVGNIIKNEVLYRIYLHPETRILNIPPRKLTELIKEARNYSFDFLKWKKDFVLKKHWLAHTKKICKRCNLPILIKYCGITKRRTFFCINCQRLYT